jgi:hypothetical protein
MKFVVLLFACVALSSAAFSQNLEFSQVKLVTSSESVPAGKVWKVTSYIPTDVFNGVVDPTRHGIGINGTLRRVGHSSSTDSVPMSTIPFPLWFPAGTVIDPAISGSNVYAVTVIEFTVVS